MNALEQITRDLNWRESELGSLKIILSRPDITSQQRKTILRAAWALLYAHYEGFVKFALSVFYDTVRSRVTDCTALPRATLVLAFRGDIARIKSTPAAEFIEATMHLHSERTKLAPEFPDVDTKSNLWPNVFEELLRDADLPAELATRHRQKITTLVSRRNGIAHGADEIIPETEYYFGFEDAVYDVMYSLAYAIDTRLSQPPYAR